MENQYLAEGKAIKAGIVPIDFNAGANAGIRVSMKNIDRVAFVISLGAGTSTTTHSFALKQHDAASSGNSKALSVANPYFHKIDDATVLTRVDPVAAADTYNLHTLLANDLAVVIFEVKAEDIDRANGYNWVSLDVADTGGAQVGAQMVIAEPNFKPGYEQAI